MNKKPFLILLTLCFSISYSCKNEQHLISDRNYRNQVEDDYAKRPFTAMRQAELAEIMDCDTVSLAEKEALKFLYAYMPYSDLADYDAGFFLKQVRYSLLARETFSWGKTVPEDVFRHFVLVYRVNNENLDTARIVFFNALKDRVKGLSMHDAALEVNHWCHEKVTYRGSDARTSAPLATMRTSLGRCGEESTFAVTALRSVGIPARQCYTPRWAHTDDNHAWVEVWIDGEWHFLGACEPEPELDMGWFSIPSTRCMMVHSNAFGKYDGDEEVTARTGLFSRVNMLGNYAPTRKITVQTVGRDGKPVGNAEVKFKLYNYSEYYPIAVARTDSEGMASLTTGLGDLLVHASDGKCYNYRKTDVRRQDTVILVLDRVPGEEYTEYLDIVPPQEGFPKVKPSAEKVAENSRRLAFEDSVRNAYTSTFPTGEQMWKMIEPRQKNDLLEEQQEKLWTLVRKSEGNYTELLDYVLNSGWHFEEFNSTYDYLCTYSDKDLRDITADVLKAQRTYFDEENPKYPLSVYKKGILPARISNEQVRPWRQPLKEALGRIATSSELRSWTLENISVDYTGNYFNCPISPMGVFALRHSDAHSRDIFFVAACRSLDIPAYLDNATNQIFVYQNGVWENVSFEDRSSSPKTGTLVLTYDKTSDVNPVYWSHYTIAKFENGDFVTFDFENDPRVAEFPAAVSLDSGYYMLSTGNRYSDGTALSKLVFFNVKAGEKVTLPVELRALVPRTESHGTLSLSQKTPWGKTLSECVKDHNLVIAFIDPNREPTRHLLSELETYKSQFENWNGTLAFLVPTDKMTKDLDLQKLAQRLPENSLIMEDKNSNWQNSIIEECDIYFRDNLPLVLVVDEKGNITFKSEGYRIGTGELLFKSLGK